MVCDYISWIRLYDHFIIQYIEISFYWCQLCYISICTCISIRWLLFLRSGFLAGYQGVCSFYTPPHDNGGVQWYHVGHPCVCPSICPSSMHPYFHYQMITWVDISGFSPNVVYALILWTCFGIVNGQISSSFDKSYLPTSVCTFISGP